MKRTSLLLLLVVFSILTIYLVSALRAQENFEIKIPDVYPRLVYTPEEIEAWKNDASKKEQIEKIARKADKILEEDLYVPKQEGNWAFYYRCSKCNVGLKPEKTGKPGSINSHVCPKCGKKYTDEKAVGGYITKLNNQLNDECFDLALAYALTEEKKYSQPVRDALLELVKIYPQLERHDRWDRKGLLAVVGGRRYCQHLTEGIGCMRLAEAFDLIAKSLTENERKKICEGFLGRTAREILTYNNFGVVGGRNNHQTWFNATYTVTGFVTGDKELVEIGLFGRFGLEWQIESSITDDGIWYEGTMDYHRYAMKAITQTLDAAKRFDYILKDNERLKSLWVGPLQMAYPDGRIPATNDSNPSSLKSFKGLYRWGYKYFEDPLFASYADIELEGRPEKIQPESAALESLGMAALRRGKGDDAICVFLDYGIHGGGHGHPDKLNIMMYGLGQEFLVDPGRISYSVPEFKTWCRTTAAHNTVVIGMSDQNPAEGELEFFKKEEDHSACLASCEGAYGSWRLSRFLLLTDEFLVDLFIAHGPKTSQTIDWFAHSYGEMSSSNKATKVDKPLGDKNGYQHLKELKKLDKPSNGNYKPFEFKARNGKVMKIHFAEEPASMVYTGTGIGTKVGQKVPFIMRRRRGYLASFATVYDLSGDGNAVTKINMKSAESDKSNYQIITVTDSKGRETKILVGKGEYEGRKFEDYLFLQE